MVALTCPMEGLLGVVFGVGVGNLPFPLGGCA